MRARTHKHKTHTQARECLIDDIGFLDEVPRACKPEGMPTYPSTHELPKGAKGLKIEARLNGKTLQSSTTSSMIFDVATLIKEASTIFTLEPGDVIVTGTPAGVGFVRKPPIFMKNGDTCEIEIEKVGLLSNPIKNER